MKQRQNQTNACALAENKNRTEVNGLFCNQVHVCSLSVSSFDFFTMFANG
jgi:hypothetical protein